MLPSMGVSTLQLEVPLHVLLVAFQEMKRSGHVWPTITEQMQEQCLQRLTARVRFNEGLPVQLADQLTTQFCNEHPERHLLAVVYGCLGEHDLLRVRTDAKKFLLLAALNIVDCVAVVGAQTAPG
ncbi:MAG: hypothetical protein RJA98_2945 [Pseudomonadota bacterium]